MRSPYVRLSPTSFGGGAARRGRIGSAFTRLIGFSPTRFGLFLLIVAAASLVYFSLLRDEGPSPRSDRVSVPVTATGSRFSLEQMRGFALRKSLSTDYKPSFYSKSATSFDRMLVEADSRFDIASQDVLVFVHIQKTAGTSFEKYLVRHLDIERPCQCTKAKKRCTCRRPGGGNETWLFSRYSTGWVCGLHADWTELAVSACVDTVLDKKEGSHHRRRYFYTSFLRDPITRFISEFRHVSRGATWIASRHVCGGRPPTPDEMPLCFDPRMGWEGVSLEEFLSCPFNLAFNRMTRMLADLTLVDCYDTSRITGEKRDAILLESAKATLRSLSFYGLKERMDDSQEMFQRLFGMRFTRRLSEWGKSKSNDTIVAPELMKKIREVNHLDIQLYAYARELFDERLSRMRKEGLPKEQIERNPTFAPVLSAETKEVVAEDKSGALQEGEDHKDDRDQRRDDNEEAYSEEEEYDKEARFR